MEEFEFVKDDEEKKKLHSGLEQQSSLICMLKQRLDSTLRSLYKYLLYNVTSIGARGGGQAIIFKTTKMITVGAIEGSYCFPTF